MPKPKQFLRDNKKKSKHVAQAPTTADEYLAAGVDFEEAGEKWRGGDAAKSTRFFIKAIECYDEALKKFPLSFDLSYNKARVQYELTQYPKLLAQLPGSLSDLLNTALESSRYALALNQDNPDVLFNTAQVLTSLVEALNDSHPDGSIVPIDPIPLLEEALELFNRCLTLQEFLHSESLAQAEAMSLAASSEAPDVDDEEGGTLLSPASTSTSTATPPQDDRWATIVEPVTNDTLLDTVLAQLETLTTLCGLINSDAGKGLAWTEEYSTSLLLYKLPAYLLTTGRDSEAALTKANFIAAMADANFRNQNIDVATYQHTLDEAYSSLDLTQDPEGLVNVAEALITLNSSLRNFPGKYERKEVAELRWKALTNALGSLTTASKLPSAESVEKIHLARGDCELLRFQLGQAPSNYDVANKNGPTLLKNAEKFYRGAAALARSAGSEKELNEASIKEALAAAMIGDFQKIRDAIKTAKDSRSVLEDAIDDGLVSVDQLVAMGIA